MTSERTGVSDREVREQAADLLARVNADDASENDWLELETWLAADEAHRTAYDRAEALWVDVEDARWTIAPALADDVSPANVVDLSPRVRRNSPMRWIGAVAAAAAIAVVVSSTLLLTPPKTDAYSTKAGETRLLALSDGSRVNLNGASSLSVAMGRSERRVVMAEAEAAFDVAADKDRPFLIDVGDRQIRVVGTEFNVGRHDNRTVVTVRRGIVEVRALQGKTPSQVARLTPGNQFIAIDGQQATTVQAVDTEEAFAWRSGRLVYRDRPIAEVAADLSRRFATPVTVGVDAQGVRFTGVLVLDDEDAVIKRLEALAPVTADRGATAITLHAARD